jgi:hypothetical protein
MKLVSNSVPPELTVIPLVFASRAVVDPVLSSDNVPAFTVVTPL